MRAPDFVGKATGSRECAPDDKLRVPTKTRTNELVGTAQMRLCPPYDSEASHDFIQIALALSVIDRRCSTI